MSQQYGFYFDAGRCIKCQTCEMACKVTNNLETGISWRQVTETWSGSYPDVTRTFFSKSCMHCENPLCLEVCPTGAIYKRAEDGIVLVDKDKCNGCRDCLTACPYDIPQFGRDGKMQKCDYCTGAGREPACTEACPAGALYSGPLDTLPEKAKGKNTERMEGNNGPSIILTGYKP